MLARRGSGCLFVAFTLFNLSSAAAAKECPPGEDSQTKGGWCSIDKWMVDKIDMIVKGDPGCKKGGRLTITYDKPSYMKMATWSDSNPYGLCSEAMDDLDAYCRGDEAGGNSKKVRKVTEIHCAYKKGTPTAHLKGSTLSITNDGSNAEKMKAAVWAAFGN